jgi:hypothetical protein
VCWSTDRGAGTAAPGASRERESAAACARPLSLSECFLSPRIREDLNRVSPSFKMRRHSTSVSSERVERVPDREDYCTS